MIPPVSIIILNWNGKRYLKKCLDSVLKQNYNNFEIILVDNASTDGSIEFIKKGYRNEITLKKIKLILNSRNYGFAEGNNIGIAHAHGRYLVFLNQDTYVDKNWLINLVSYAQKNKKLGICGPKILDYDNPKIIQSKGSELDFLGTPYHRGFNEIDKNMPEDPKIVSFICGAAFLVKREVLNKLSYCFDPSYFAYFEEVDLCWRAKLLGYECVYVPSAVIYHKGKGPVSEKFIFLNARNKILSFKKNIAPPLRAFFVFLVFLRGAVSLLYWFSKKKISINYLPLLVKTLFTRPNYDVPLAKIPFSQQLSIFRPPRFKIMSLTK